MPVRKKNHRNTEHARSCRQVRRRIQEPDEVPVAIDFYNSVDYCLNCRRSNTNDGIDRVVYTECNMDSSMFRRKFCLVDRELFTRHQNSDQILKAKLCMECSRYMKKETRLTEIMVNYDWSIVWPAFIWQFLMSPSISAKWGIKTWCIIPHHWRIWWLSQYRLLFNNRYSEATLTFPKQVIRDLTERKKKANKLITDLRIFEIEREWCNVLKCTVLCPFGCTEFVHKTKSLPLDIVIARSLDLTDKDMKFVTPNPAVAIDSMLRGIRNDYLTFPMEHTVSKLNNPDPEWEVLPGLAFINEQPQIQVCRDCGSGSNLHFLYPPRNPFHLIPCPPYGEQISPVSVRSNILKSARASKYTDRHQMLHLQGHVNGVNTIRVTTENHTTCDNQMSIPYDSLALQGREDIKAYVVDMMSNDNPSMPQESGDLLFKLADNLGDLEKYKDFYESATYIASDIALKLEIDGKNKRKQCVIVPSATTTNIPGRVPTTTTRHFTATWPRIIPYVHPYNKHGCKFPSLFTHKGTQHQQACEKVLWSVSGVIGMVQPIWDALALAELYDIKDIDGYILSFVSKICFTHLCRYMTKNYPFYFEGCKSANSTSARRGLMDKFEEFGAVKDDFVSALDLVLKNAHNVKRIAMPSERIDLNEQFQLGELHDKDCLVCTTNDTIECDLSNTKWELRFVCGDLRGNQQIYVRHDGEELAGWWNVKSDTKFVTKSPLVDLSLLQNDIILVFVKKKSNDYNKMRRHFLQSIGGQSYVYCRDHDKPLIVHAKNENMSNENNRLKCCYKDCSAEECSKRISYCCPVKNCYSCVCSKHIKEATSAAKGKPKKRVHLGSCTHNAESTMQINSTRIAEETLDNSTGLEEEEISPDSGEVDRAGTEFEMIDLDVSPYIGTFQDNVKTSETEQEKVYVSGMFINCEEDEEPLAYIGQTTMMAQDMLPSSESKDHCFSLSTTASMWKPTVCRFKKDTISVNGAVILNNCGTLLARGFRKLTASIWQGNFLQRLVATIPGRSIPLLYAEGTLFPSIFWKDDCNCSILGAIPTALLASDKTLSNYGIASIPSHLKNRMRMCGDSLCCQNQDYLCYAYDSMANLSCRGEDTRLVLRRGGMTNSVSLKKEDKNLMFDSDSIESRPHVNQLCAKMRDCGATYFGSHSANHHDHFGLKAIKEWIDSDELHQLTLKELLTHKYTYNTGTLQEQINKAIMESSTITLLRHWQETTELYMKYICHSPEQPLGKVVNAWYRHEYQESAGNLSHLHFLLWIDPSEDQCITLNRIRGSYLQFISPEELEEFVNDGMEKNTKHGYIQDLAQKFLTHICSKRCKKRKDSAGNLQCRVSNNGLESPSPYKHCIKDVDVSHTEAASDILVQLGLMKKTKDNTFVALTAALQGHKHYPPSRAWEGKFSPCNNRLFAATKSNQNLIYVTGYFASRYVAKYSAKIDESTRVFIGAGQKEANSLTLDVQFLHNTKITGSKINEEKLMLKRKDKNHPTGRAISIMEMMQATLGYDMVFTDIVFERLTTTPLGERAGFKISRRAPEKRGNRRNFPEDLSSQDYIATYVIRNQENRTRMQEWQKLSPSETIIMRDMALSDVSIDKITIFGVRPPELRFVQRPELYFKWFYRTSYPVIEGNIQRQLESLRHSIHYELNLSKWIDGLGHGIYVRPKAVTHVLDWLRNMADDRPFYCSDHNIPSIVPTIARDSMIYLFEILESMPDETDMILDDTNGEDGEIWNRFFGPCKSLNATRPQRELPIIWYDSVPPTQAHRFVIHLLLSMGNFDNELNLLTHQTMRQCFEYASLIPQEVQDEESLLKHCRTLLRNYVMEQLLFQPCGTKQFDRYLVAAWHVIRECIVHNELPFREIPACLYTQLSSAIEKAATNLEIKTKTVMIETVLDNLSKKGINTGCTLAQLQNATVEHPVDFTYVLEQADGQSTESIDEQTELFEIGKSKFRQYMSGQNQTTKGLIINGGPGTGKTTLMELLILYAQHLGLTSILTAVMAERASELGGTHIAQIMAIPVNKGASYARLAEMAHISLLKAPDKLALLRKVDIFFIDEFGTVSAELLSTMDIIMRRLRNSSQFMGGVVNIATYDYLQLAPVGGHPPLLSPHMLTSFTLKKLEHSVRAGKDPILQKIQQYTRLSPREFAEIREEFVSAVMTNCTFVDRFDDISISPTTLRMFGKRRAARVATDSLLAQMKEIHGSSMIASHANDQEASVEGVFVTATKATSQYLTTKAKEPSTLWLFPGALYEITYNKKNQFNSTQIAVLVNVPDISHVADKKPIELIIAPAGCKSLPPNLSCFETLVSEHGWKVNKVGVCTDRIQTFGYGIQAKRIQYGLKHRIASTIHSGMGQDLPSIVTRVTSEDEDKDYALWTKEQVIVLLSRTHYARDITFVGDPFKTASALADCLQHVSQYTDYMTHIMKTMTSTGTNTTPNFLDPYMYSPFRMCDFEILNTAASFCYHLVSLGDPTKTTSYIGETGNLAMRLTQHNQARGARATRDSHLIPWALMGFVSGFEGNERSERQRFENDWKAHRNARERVIGCHLSPNDVGAVAVGLIQNYPRNRHLIYTRCAKV